jgi:hypothetical protein
MCQIPVVGPVRPSGIGQCNRGSNSGRLTAAIEAFVFCNSIVSVTPSTSVTADGIVVEKLALGAWNLLQETRERWSLAARC